MKNISRIKELQKVFNLTDANFESFKNFFKDKFVLADHDGSICDTNQVKDELLGEFCRSQLGVNDKNGKTVQDSVVNAIHRGAHGLPMNMIFVDILKQVYGQDISLEKGQEITENLNNYIRPNYMNRKMYDKAGEYHDHVQPSPYKSDREGIQLHYLKAFENSRNGEVQDREQQLHKEENEHHSHISAGLLRKSFDLGVFS
jgi:hypothetical protein